MTKAEILAELPQLSPQDRADILDQLWRLEALSLHPAVKSATGIISADVDGRETHRAHLAFKHT